MLDKGHVLSKNPLNQDHFLKGSVQGPGPEAGEQQRASQPASRQIRPRNRKRNFSDQVWSFQLRNQAVTVPGEEEDAGEAGRGMNRKKERKSRRERGNTRNGQRKHVRWGPGKFPQNA